MGEQEARAEMGEEQDAQRQLQALLFQLRPSAKRLTAPYVGPERSADLEAEILQMNQTVDVGVFGERAPPDEHGSLSATALGLIDAMDVQHLNGFVHQSPCAPPLMYAAEFGLVAIIDGLIQAGVDVEIRTGGGGRPTPLMKAARQRQLSAVERLLAAGADPLARDDYGVTALGNAVLASDDKTLPVLRVLADAIPAGRARRKAIEGALPLIYGPNKQEVRQWILDETGVDPARDRCRGKGVRCTRNRTIAALPREGAEALREAHRDHQAWLLCFFDAPIDEVGRAICEGDERATLHEHLEKRGAWPAPFGVPIVKLAGQPWSVVVWSAGERPEQPIVRPEEFSVSLSKAIGCRLLVFDASDGNEALDEYNAGALVVREDYSWNDPKRERDFLATRGVFAPPVFPQNEGTRVKVTFKGMKADDVERVDYVGWYDGP